MNSEKLDLPTLQIICLLYHRFVAIEKKNCRFHLDQGIYIANKVTKATKSMTGSKGLKWESGKKMNFSFNVNLRLTSNETILRNGILIKKSLKMFFFKNI